MVVVDLFMIGYMTGPASLAPILIVRPRGPVARGPRVRAATAQAALLGGAEAPQAAPPSPSPDLQHPLAATGRYQAEHQVEGAVTGGDRGDRSSGGCCRWAWA